MSWRLRRRRIRRLPAGAPSRIASPKAVLRLAAEKAGWDDRFRRERAEVLPTQFVFGPTCRRC